MATGVVAGEVPSFFQPQRTPAGVTLVAAGVVAVAPVAVSVDLGVVVSVGVAPVAITKKQLIICTDLRHQFSPNSHRANKLSA